MIYEPPAPDEGTYAPMAPDDIRVHGKARAKHLKRRFSGVLSLHDPHMHRNSRIEFNRQPAPLHLTLLFDDIEDMQYVSRGWIPVTEDQVARGIEFCRTVPGPLMIHCHAGVSRSGAFAYAVFCDRMGPGHEAEAMAKLLEVRDCAVPNGMIVAMADKFLMRQGAMIAVYEEKLAATPSWRLRKKLQRETWEKYYPHDFVNHHRR